MTQHARRYWRETLLIRQWQSLVKTHTQSSSIDKSISVCGARLPATFFPLMTSAHALPHHKRLGYGGKREGKIWKSNNPAPHDGHWSQTSDRPPPPHSLLAPKLLAARYRPGWSQTEFGAVQIQSIYIRLENNSQNQFVIGLVLRISFN